MLPCGRSTFRGRPKGRRGHPKTLYIPAGNDYVENAINDQLAYGTPDVMKKYARIFDTSLELLERKEVIPHPETLTLSNIKYHNVTVERVHVVYRLDK